MKTWFNAALQVGAKFRGLAYVASMAEFETTRYSNNRFHETFGDWIQLIKDDYDSGCGCGVVRRYGLSHARIIIL